MCVSIPKEITLNSLKSFPRGEQILHPGDWAASQDQPQNLAALVWFIPGLDWTAHGCSHPCSPVPRPAWVWLHWTISNQFNWAKFRPLNAKCAQIGQQCQRDQACTAHSIPAECHHTRHRVEVRRGASHPLYANHRRKDSTCRGAGVSQTISKMLQYSLSSGKSD